MSKPGWKQLFDGWPWFRGEAGFPVLPNSEFMPPVRLGRKPYGTWDTLPLAEADPWGWPITEYDEALTLRPGLRDIAHHILNKLIPLCHGEAEHGIALHKLRNNPYWTAELAAGGPALAHERFVLLLPLALSLTQDDKAQIRWTLYGNSAQNPAQAFWKGFYTAPGQEIAAERALAFFRHLLAGAYEEPEERLADLLHAGFRILPLKDAARASMPSWTADYLLGERASLKGVKYVLTFRPFRDIPAAMRRKYLAGELHLLPFPGSLLFWGVSSYDRLANHLHLANQVPLLHFIERHEEAGKIRIPQSGWFHEPGPKAPADGHAHGPVRETYKRPFRQDRVHRHADNLATAREHRLAHVLFSTSPKDIDLYHKPMARNVQLWTHDFRPLLDGPTATPDDIRRAAETVAAGGVFGYRFMFPGMNVGEHEVFWHRPLCAYLDRRTYHATLVHDAPTGYLTARHGRDNDKPVELWPRMLQREPHVANLELFQGTEEKLPLQTLTNVHKLLDAWERRGRQPLPRTFARQLLTVGKTITLEGWLRDLPRKTPHRERGRELVEQLHACLAPPEKPAASARKAAPPSLTYAHTATRAFEEEYWNTIAHLSSGDFLNKNNADCVLDKPTQAALAHAWRDLEGLGNYLLAYYARLLAEHGMTDSVRFGELPFRWQTEYAFPWMGGWVHNQEGKAYERNLLVMIPGRDRKRAVIMADHYDTAYMYDWYEKEYGGTGARLSAPGADDNCSATVALMLGAVPFLELSRQGKLDCDIWLLHLTGEEYPAEGQGTCRMCQWLVEGTLALPAARGKAHDLSKVRVQGVYVLDMVAHKNNKERDVFQIAPGVSREALWLAYQAHIAAHTWNLSTEAWNRQPARKGAPHGKRSRDGKTLPPLARHLPLHGEVRPHFDPRSTLFNTDGQMFSDVGVPVVLFMENYDINRVGYHDTHDNMTNINLDYGAALAAITIESVARAATERDAESFSAEC